MKLVTRFKHLAALVVLSTWGMSAHAVLLTFTDRASWEAAAPGSVAPTGFETPDASNAATGGAGFLDFTVSGFSTPQPVNFTVGAGNELFLVSPDLDGTLLSQVLQAQQSAGPSTQLTVTLPVLSQAFALEMAALGGPVTVDFNVANNDNDATSATAGGAFSFFGVTSDTPFTSIVISAPAGLTALRLDTFFFTQPSTGVPIPATLPLVVGGVLLGIAGLRRRMTNAAQRG